MTKKSSALLAVALMLLGVPDSADACMHLVSGPSSVSTTVQQKGQHGIVIHRDGIEDLILQVEYEISGAAQSKLAWVIPVPNAPTNYEAYAPGLFEAMHEWADLREIRQQPRLRSASAMSAGERPRAAASAPPPLRMLPPASVGPYAIQPIQGRGPEAGEALNAWMRSNGFSPLPGESMAYYLDRGWTFLAVKADAGGASLAAEGGLPPLGIRFPSEHAVYPLKFSTHMGEFPLRLYVITPEALPGSVFAAAVQRGFRVAGRGTSGALGHLGDTRGGTVHLRARDPEFRASDAPAALQPILAAAGLSDQENLQMRVLLNERVRGQDAAGWDEDLAFPPFVDRADASSPAAPAEAAPPVNAVEIASPSEDPPLEPEVAVAPASVTSEDSSGCATGGSGSAGLGWLLAAAFILRRRRRRDLRRHRQTRAAVSCPAEQATT